jgi:hypothetical protein
MTEIVGPMKSSFNVSSVNAEPPNQPKHPSLSQGWYRPTLAPEHGVYIVLFVSFLTGAAAAQQWTLATTLALICAFAGFQAEHPLALQIKQRRSWKPRFLLWGGIYAGIALGIAVYLYLQAPVLLWLYLGAIAAFLVDMIAVFYRKQKSVANELLTFAAVCIAAPFAYIATNGTWTFSVLGLWLLNTLFFGSAIFTVKLRKAKTASLVPGLIYHAIASLGIVSLCYCGGLATFTALAFGVVLLKFGFILWRQEWYQITQIQNVAILETSSALAFLAIIVISLLPAHLPGPS